MVVHVCNRCQCREAHAWDACRSVRLSCQTRNKWRCAVRSISLLSALLICW